MKANTQEKGQKRGLVSGNLLPCLPGSQGSSFGRLLQACTAPTANTGCSWGTLPLAFGLQLSCVVSPEPWQPVVVQTVDRGLEELASRIEAVVFRGGGRCSCSHARGLRSGISEVRTRFG